MKHLLLAAVLVASVAAAIVSCSDSFNPPELPDLGKNPYDFAVVVPPFEGGDGGVRDMTLPTEPHDFAGVTSD